MRYSVIIRIVSYIMLLFSCSVVAPIFVSLYYHDGDVMPFAITGAIEISIGLIGWLSCRHQKQQLKVRDGFLVVTAVWLSLSLVAALPFYLSSSPHLTLINALFEAVSGLTTTGATILKHISTLPQALLFYRQELQFLGGMGIVVLAVAVLPVLGIGGMQLYRAETPGPMKDRKLTPRIAETAKALWFIYLLLTVACALSYWFAGMTLFDAIGESFSTIATGGFSLHDSSFSFYHSNLIYSIAMIFMLLSSISFAIHYSSFKQRTLKMYWKDIECRFFFWILMISAAFTIFVLLFNHVYSNLSDNIMKGLFTVVSMATTTGFTNAKFSHWPSFIPFMLMFIGIIGACGGSTAGGIKVIRFVLICKQSVRELYHLIHPEGVYPLKFGERILNDRTVQAMWGFIGMFIALFVLLTFILLATGMDLVTAFSAVVDTLANVGAGIGAVTDSFAHVGVIAKIVLMISMIIGRLEIFTVLLLFTPEFWRQYRLI